MRSGHTYQTKSLLDPDTLAVWDRRLDSGLSTLDTGAYLDSICAPGEELGLSGGVRADLLSVSVENRLGYDVPARAQSGGIPGTLRSTQALALGPRSHPRVRVRSRTHRCGLVRRGIPLARRQRKRRHFERDRRGGTEHSRGRQGLLEGSLGRGGPARASGGEALVRDRFMVRKTGAERTGVRSKLGGFSTQGASVRRGFIASAVAKPFPWLLASLATSVSSSTFTTLVPGISHYVPNVPPVLFRVDVTARGTLTTLAGVPVTARAALAIRSFPAGT